MDTVVINIVIKPGNNISSIILNSKGKAVKLLSL